MAQDLDSERLGEDSQCLLLGGLEVSVLGPLEPVRKSSLSVYHALRDALVLGESNLAAQL